MWLYQRDGLPEKDEIVLCSVERIEYHSVFVKLIQFKDLTGLIKISEVSPGRIRNIRDYVKEKSIIVCKVLFINYDSGLIELSLRRVNKRERREKLNEMKEEQLAEKIISNVSKKLNMDVKKVYDEVSSKVLKYYNSLFEAFQKYVDNVADLDKLNINKKILDELKKELKATLSPTEVTLKAIYTINSYDSYGADKIKNAFKEAQTDLVKVKYGGGGNYNIIIKCKDFKTGEKILNDFRKKLEKALNDKNTVYEFKRI